MNTGSLQKKSNLLRDLSKNKILLLMILPAVLYYFIFSYLPMAGSILAFKNYNYRDGIFLSPSAGFDNFKFLFLGGKIYKVAFNTIAYNAVFMIVNHSLQIMSAIFFAEIASKRFKKIVQSFTFFPYFMSWVVVGAFIANIFHYEFGSLNTLLRSLGMEPVNAFRNVGIWKYILVTCSAWKWIGYGTIIYLASIMGIDNELFEAADIDGASKFQKTRRITLPLMVPTIITLVLLTIGNIFKGDFSMFYQVTGNNPLLQSSTDVIDTFVVRALLKIQDVGMASAAGLMQSIISFFVLVSCNALVRRYQKDYALF